jgi:hypothetical protein
MFEKLVVYLFVNKWSQTEVSITDILHLSLDVWVYLLDRQAYELILIYSFLIKGDIEVASLAQ